jgi:hypothetical protein
MFLLSLAQLLTTAFQEPVDSSDPSRDVVLLEVVVQRSNVSDVASGFIAFSPGGRYLTTAAWGGDIINVFDTGRRTIRSTIPIDDGFRGYLWAPDGESLFVFGENTIEVRDPLDGSLLERLGAEVLDVSADAVSGCIARLIDDERGRRVRMERNGEVTEFAYAADGITLADGGRWIWGWSVENDNERFFIHDTVDGRELFRADHPNCADIDVDSAHALLVYVSAEEDITPDDDDEHMCRVRYGAVDLRDGTPLGTTTLEGALSHFRWTEDGLVELSWTTDLFEPQEQRHVARWDPRSSEPPVADISAIEIAETSSTDESPSIVASDLMSGLRLELREDPAYSLGGRPVLVAADGTEVGELNDPVVAGVTHGRGPHALLYDGGSFEVGYFWDLERASREPNGYVAFWDAFAVHDDLALSLATNYPRVSLDELATGEQIDFIVFSQDEEEFTERSLDLADDGRWAASLSNAIHLGRIVDRELEEGAPIVRALDSAAPSALFLTGRADELVEATCEGRLSFFDLSTGTERIRLQLPDEYLLDEPENDWERRKVAVEAVVPGPDSTLLVLVRDRLLVAGAELQPSPIDARVHAVTYDAEADLLALREGDRIRVRNRSSLAIVHDWPAASATWTKGLSFLAEGRLLLDLDWSGERHVWRLGAEGGALTLLATRDGGFAIVTSDGYYHASRDGALALAFRRGKHLLSQREADIERNRPDLILERLGLADPASIDEARRAVEERRASVLASAPVTTSGPTLQFGETPPLLHDASTLAIDLVATDRSLIEVRVNGVPEVTFEDIAAGPVRAEVRLLPGENHISAVAVDAAGNRGPRIDATVTGTFDAPEPTLWFLGIGVDQYADANHRLTLAVADVRAMASVFEGLWSGPVERRILPDGEVTREAVLAALAELNRSGLGDLVVVYLAGHGMRDQQGYLFGTHDVDFAAPRERGIAHEEIEALLGRIDARRRLLLIDTCHSGASKASSVSETSPAGETNAARGFGQTVDAVAAEFRRGIQLEFADLANRTGLTVLAAAGANEVAFESAALGNGVFTHAIRAGLTDRFADLNGDLRITGSELLRYTSNRVERWSGGTQVPNAPQENLDFDYDLLAGCVRPEERWHVPMVDEYDAVVTVHPPTARVAVLDSGVLRILDLEGRRVLGQQKMSPEFEAHSLRFERGGRLLVVNGSPQTHYCDGVTGEILHESDTFHPAEGDFARCSNDTWLVRLAWLGGTSSVHSDASGAQTVAIDLSNVLGISDIAIDTEGGGATLLGSAAVGRLDVATGRVTSVQSLQAAPFDADDASSFPAKNLSTNGRFAVGVGLVNGQPTLCAWDCNGPLIGSIGVGSREVIVITPDGVATTFSDLLDEETPAVEVVVLDPTAPSPLFASPIPVPRYLAEDRLFGRQKTAWVQESRDRALIFVHRPSGWNLDDVRLQGQAASPNDLRVYDGRTGEELGWYACSNNYTDSIEFSSYPRHVASMRALVGMDREGRVFTWKVDF